MALTLSKRMDIVEQKLAGLESLPVRMTALESQFVQLREEMRAEFSAFRSEVHTGDEAVVRTLREEIRAGDEAVIRTLREEIRAGDEAVIRTLREEIRAGDDETQRVLREEISAVRQEMRAGDEETRRVLREEIAGLGTHMRVLHEALVEQIKLIQEGRPDRRRPRR